MSAPTIDRPDVDILQDVDLEDLFAEDVPCEFRDAPSAPGCGRPAQWRLVVVCPGCGRDGSTNICDPHRRGIVPILNRPNTALVCPGCQGRIFTWQWRPL